METYCLSQTCPSYGDVTREDSQQRVLAQHSVAKLLLAQLYHCSNIATLCCAKNRRCESSRVTSPLAGVDCIHDLVIRYGKSLLCGTSPQRGELLERAGPPRLTRRLALRKEAPTDNLFYSPILLIFRLSITRLQIELT